MRVLNSRATFLILLVSMVAYLMVYAGAMDKGEPLTEFYVLGAEGKAEGYPLNLTKGEAGAVTVGVVNREFKDVEYLLVMSYGGEVQKKPITLRDSEKWEGRFTFTFNSSGRQKVEFLLYKGEEPYRRLHLWVEVGK